MRDEDGRDALRLEFQQQVQKGLAQITLDAFPFNGLLAALVLLLWVAVATAALGADRFERFARFVRGRGRTPVVPGALPSGEVEP